MTFSSIILPLAKNFCQATQLQCEQLADFLLPRRCSVCMTELATAPALCPTCWMDLHFIESPICARTGVPLPFDLGPESVSLSAMRFPPAYDRARSALIYNVTARQLIQNLNFIIGLKSLIFLPRGWRHVGRIYLKMQIILSLSLCIYFVLSVVVIINQRNWLERCQNQAVSL